MTDKAYIDGGEPGTKNTISPEDKAPLWGEGRNQPKLFRQEAPKLRGEEHTDPVTTYEAVESETEYGTTITHYGTEPARGEAKHGSTLYREDNTGALLGPRVIKENRKGRKRP